jgi:hypothetical protein
MALVGKVRNAWQFYLENLKGNRHLDGIILKNMPQTDTVWACRLNVQDLLCQITSTVNIETEVLCSVITINVWRNLVPPSSEVGFTFQGTDPLNTAMDFHIQFVPVA